MKLDRKKPFGTISGELFTPPGCDRPARYEQDGMFFDVHDRLIQPGVPGGDPDSEPEEFDDGPLPPMTAAELLKQADNMPMRNLKAAAKQILGDACPSSKAAIIEALQAVQKVFDERLVKRKKQTAAAKAPAPAAGDVDLAAWARGQKEYLWGEVRKAIKTTYGRKCDERDDAVEFLISQGIVSAEEARRDVLRQAAGG